MSGSPASSEALRALRVFADVEPDILAGVVAHTRVHTAAPRGVIIERGDPVTGILVVASGQVELSFMTIDGEASILGFLGPPMMVGDAAILDAGPYAVTVTAAPECDYLWIEAGPMLHAMQRSARLSLNVARELARRLRMLARRNEWNLAHSVPVRLARFLVWMADQQHGTRKLHLTQEQLGNLIGVSRETVNKYLRRWAQSGWLVQRGRSIVVLDRERLRQYEEPPQVLSAS